MEHRNIITLGRRLPLLMILVVLGTTRGQTGLNPNALTDQSLSAYSTDFLYGNQTRVYESPNPKKNEIWIVEDMIDFDFDYLLDFAGAYPPSYLVSIKSIINESDVPIVDKDLDVISVEIYLYDPAFAEGYDPEKKFLSFYETLENNKKNKKPGKDPYDVLLHDYDPNQHFTARPNDIFDMVYSSGIDFGVLDDFDGRLIAKSRSAIFRITFKKHPSKIIDFKIPLIGKMGPQELLYSQTISTYNLPNSNRNLPSSNRKIVDFSGASDIYRWKWEGSDLLYGTKNNILNIAEVDFSQDSDLKLQLDYVFKDPRSDKANFNPKTFKNSDGTPGILSAEELAKAKSMDLVEPIMIDQPQSGMFDVVSHRAARAGALFAVNGAFYDYYYYCLPGVKTSLKVNGHWRYKPDIFNHRNTGALVFNKTDFDFIRNVRHDNYIKDAKGESYTEAKKAYGESGEGWPNLMSGGHFSELGKPYRFYMPKVNEELKKKELYFWERPEVFYTMGNETIKGQEDKGPIADRYKEWNKEEFGIWARIACQRFDNSSNPYSFADAFKPDFFSNPRTVDFGMGDVSLSVQDASNLYTTVDYLRYPHEFGVQKRGRTFIAKKGNHFYIITADGLYSPTCLYGGKEHQAEYYAKTAPGLTIDELSDLSQKLEFESLLNLDGGGSSTFFVNGQGMLQSPYAGFAEGPMQQRYLSTTLMVVPKIIPDNIKSESFENKSHLNFDNSSLAKARYQPTHEVLCIDKKGDEQYLDGTIVPYNTWPQVQALSLTPSLEKFTEVGDANQGGIVAGNFKAEGEGAILFAMSENGQYEKKKDAATNKDLDEVLNDTARSLFVIGIGKMPKELIDMLELLGSTITNADEASLNYSVKKNNQSFYAVLINDQKIEYFLFIDESSTGAHKKYIDGQWHNFSLGFLWDAVQKKFREYVVFVDGEGVLEKKIEIPHLSSGIKGFNLFNAKHVTHAMIGAIPLKGGYVTGPESNLSVDNYMFVVGAEATESFLESIRRAHEKTFILKGALKQMSQDIKGHNLALPSYYTGFGWNDPNKNQWYLQFEEGKGYHAHAVNENQTLDESGKPYFYGLNLWGSWVTESSAKKEIADTDK
uniref:phosphodiester glycosidase family protein n=1 Tax=Ulvibacterium marinum TaxID=2419782 RepID=UPI0024946BDC